MGDGTELQNIIEQVVIIVGGIGALCATIGTIISRFKATNPNNSLVKRIAMTFDASQVVDNTRKIDE